MSDNRIETGKLHRRLRIYQTICVMLCTAIVALVISMYRQEQRHREVIRTISELEIRKDATFKQIVEEVKRSFGMRQNIDLPQQHDLFMNNSPRNPDDASQDTP